MLHEHGKSRDGVTEAPFAGAAAPGCFRRASRRDGHRQAVPDDADLDRRLDASRSRVQVERAQGKALRRHVSETNAAASAQKDRSTSAVLRARGLPAVPPTPSYVPDERD